jgi:hypothetical protein
LAVRFIGNDKSLPKNHKTLEIGGEYTRPPIFTGLIHAIPMSATYKANALHDKLVSRQLLKMQNRGKFSHQSSYGSKALLV